MTEFKVGDRVQTKTAFGDLVGVITRIETGADLPYRVQFEEGHFAYREAEYLKPADEPTDFLDAAGRSSDLLASVQTEAEDSSIAHDYRDVLTGIQEFFDARPEVRRSFGGGTMVDKNLIAYATRLEEENRALQAANRRAEKAEDALRKINDLIAQGYAYRDIRSVIWSVIE